MTADLGQTPRHRGTAPGSPVGATGQPGAVPALQLDGIGVDYGDGPALVGFDLQVQRGEWVALLGPNGAGKSTALGVMTGLVTHSGSVTIAGQDPRTWDPRNWARSVALVPQRPIIPAGLTVGDYVLLGRTAHMPRFGVEDMTDLAVTDDALARLDLHQFATRPVLNLSGGELQRVVLARALVQQAPLMLLDEPTAALDVGHGQQVLELVDELRREQGLTIISAMHDLTLAGQYADRLVMLAAGRVVAEGNPGEVLTAARISTHYDARVAILHHGDGIVVAPVRPRTPTPATPGPAHRHDDEADR